jgi:hypothetical protein
MAVSHGYSKITTSGSVFSYDLGDTFNSYKGEPTTNFIPNPYDYSLYAYVSGPVNTTTTNELGNIITAKRYTITQAVNVARAAIFPTSLSTGVAYTFSVKWRYNGITTTTPGLGMDASKGNPEVGGSNGFTSQASSVVPIGQGWYLSTYTFIFSTSPTLGCILTFGISTGATAGFVNETFDIYEAQFEVKDHRTQPVIGTRSISGSVIDISGYNRTVNAVSGGYNSQAKLSFNGSSNVLDLGSLGTIGTQYSIECIFNSANIVSYRNVYDMNYATYNPNTGNVGPRLEQLSSQAIYWIWSGNTTTNGLYNLSTAISISPNTYYHTVFTLNAGTVNTYLNGGLRDVNLSSAQGYITSFQDVKVGRGFVLDPSRFFSGSIDVLRVYDRVLTGPEVLNNYYHYKTRFNLP